MKRVASIIIIVFIIFLGLFIRCYRLDLNIPSLYSDEVSSGYFAYLVSQEPIQSFSDFLHINFHIKTATFTWFLGLTPLGVRLPSVVYGTVLLLILYLFTKQINFGEIKYKNLIPFIALVLFSFVPWGIHLSRLQPFVLLYLVMLGLHWIFYIKAKTPKEYFISIVPLFIATYFYSSGIILGPLFIVMLIIKTRNNFLKRNTKIVAFLTIAIMGVFVLLLPTGGERGFDLAIWRDVNVTANENVDRSLARLSEPTIFSLKQNPDVMGKLFYNHSISVVNVFTRNYLSFFSPDFLFLKGDPVLRHSTGRFGVLYLILLPFLIYGVYLMTIKGDRKIKEMFFFWIIVAPIPGAITKDGSGYLLRVATMLPLLTYLSALGFVGSLELFTKKIKIFFFLTVSLLFFFSVYGFLFNYFHVYPLASAKSFEFGFKELADFQKKNNQSMLVIWDGYYPHFYFRFWQATNVKEYSLFTPTDIKINQSVFHKMYSNLYFSLPQSEADFEKFTEENNISFIVFPSELLGKYSKYILLNYPPFETVFYPDQTPAFYLYQIDKL